MDMQDFKARCRFLVEGNKLHASCCVELPDGRVVRLKTSKGEGIDLNKLTYELAKSQVNGVGGFWGSAWKSAKRAATKVAENKATKTLATKAVKVTSDAAKLAASPQGQAALSFVPGGNAVNLGIKAANLIESSKKGNPQATARIAKLKEVAESGKHPNAAMAYKILQRVYALGQARQAWGPVPQWPMYNPYAAFASYPGGGPAQYQPGVPMGIPGVSGYAWERYPRGAYSPIQLKTPANWLRLKYAQAVNR